MRLPDTLRELNGRVEPDGNRAIARELSRLRSWTYQLAASLAYKFGEPALGIVAAERGLSAAGAAGDPLLGGVALTRLAHGWRSLGHLDEAIDLTLRGAASIDESGLGDSASAGVHGALLLHSAMATARKSDVGTARSLLAEARSVARYSGDANHYYTAFGPANVDVWTVAVLARSGDTPGALARAEKVDVSHLPVAERKGAFLVDHATALAAHGRQRDEHALDLLQEAERLAPEEVFGRPGSRALLESLARRAGPSWSGRAHQLAGRMAAAR
ncbi:MAG: hypothetical protein ACRCYQ_03780 [Nocardioides sp.]